ncbi:MAG: hypothetical protein ACI8ZB_000004 [Desulforhopalus sp.]|jgi:hypothetical protein
MGLILITFILYGISACVLIKYVAGSPNVVKKLQRTFVVTIAGFAGQLALTEV